MARLRGPADTLRFFRVMEPSLLRCELLGQPVHHWSQVAFRAPFNQGNRGLDGQVERRGCAGLLPWCRGGLRRARGPRKGPRERILWCAVCAILTSSRLRSTPCRAASASSVRPIPRIPIEVQLGDEDDVRPQLGHDLRDTGDVMDVQLIEQRSDDGPRSRGTSPEMTPYLAGPLLPPPAA